MQENMTYESVGVKYDVLDLFKRRCQERARKTAKNAMRLGLEFLEESYGESVQMMHQFVADKHHHFFGLVEEGLGTKNLVADAMLALTGKSHYKKIARD